ncbi:MAG: PIN domain-containing protein [Spirochaetaceae bacterium]|nr:PIN domain-containing protein [Spirochaetaceae bacterium]
MVFLDTHAVVWLFQKDLKRFGSLSLDLLEKESLYISPAVLLELEYLYEIDRIRLDSRSITDFLSERIGLEIDPVSFLPISERACALKWTRDPFDRIITAQAQFHNAILLSKDKTIAENYSKTCW